MVRSPKYNKKEIKNRNWDLGPILIKDLRRYSKIIKTILKNPIYSIEGDEKSIGTSWLDLDSISLKAGEGNIHLDVYPNSETVEEGPLEIRLPKKAKGLRSNEGRILNNATESYLEFALKVGRVFSFTANYRVHTKPLEGSLESN